MKNKKILLIVCSMLCMLMFTACGQDTAVQTVGGDMSDDEIYSMAEDYLTYLQSFTEEGSYEEMKDDDFLAAADMSALEEVQDLSIMKVVADSYTSSLDQLGAFEGISDRSIVREEDSLTVDLTADYEKHQLKMQAVFDEDMVLESITADTVLTVKEILMKALQNTLLGMGTVFVVLIFISLVISCFKLISKAQNRSKAKKKVQTSDDVKQVESVSAPVEEEADEIDDYELVAVISAAIAAAEETSVDGFRVRSIKRAKNSTWNRA